MSGSILTANEAAAWREMAAPEYAWTVDRCLRYVTLGEWTLASVEKQWPFAPWVGNYQQANYHPLVAAAELLRPVASLIPRAVFDDDEATLDAALSYSDPHTQYQEARAKALCEEAYRLLGPEREESRAHLLDVIWLLSTEDDYRDDILQRLNTVDSEEGGAACVRLPFFCALLSALGESIGISKKRNGK